MRPQDNDSSQKLSKQLLIKAAGIIIVQIVLGVWIVLPNGTLNWFYFTHMVYQGSLNIYIITRYAVIYDKMRSHRLNLVNGLEEVDD